VLYFYFTMTRWDGLLVDEAGQFKHSLPTGLLAVPRAVEILGGEVLLYDPMPAAEVVPDATVLSDFASLADAPADWIRDFVARWGALHLCEHGLPSTHNQLPVSFVQGIDPSCRPLGLISPIQGMWWEPLAEWRFWSRREPSWTSQRICTGTAPDLRPAGKLSMSGRKRQSRFPGGARASRWIG